VTEKVTIQMRVAVHPIQAELWKHGLAGNIKPDMSLREIGELLGLKDEPQKIKHHLQRMVSMGSIDYIGGKYVFPAGSQTAAE
jgi:hypothetical protein